MSEPLCADCRFFEEMLFGGVVSQKQGRCRRRAPRAWATDNPNDTDRDARWPHVATDDWCGEFQPEETP